MKKQIHIFLISLINEYIVDFSLYTYLYVYHTSTLKYDHSYNLFV